MNIVAILGEARTGKDHAAALIRNTLAALGIPATVSPIADRLRALVPRIKPETDAEYAARCAGLKKGEAAPERRTLDETKEQWSVRLVEQGKFYAERYGYDFLCREALENGVTRWQRDWVPPTPSRRAVPPVPVVILSDVRRVEEFNRVLREDPRAFVIRLNARDEVRQARMGGAEEWERYRNGRGRDATESALRGISRVDARVIEIASNDEAEFQAGLSKPFAAWIASLEGRA